MKKILSYLIPILFILTCQSNAVTLTQKIGSGYITQTVRPGHQVTLRFVNKPNYEFEKWEVESGSVSIDTTNPVITFAMPSTDVVIRGQYKAVEKQYYTVTFDANGGTGAMTPQTIEQGKSSAVSSNTFTRNGYEFKGWSTTSNGSVAYANQATINPSGNITLYAVWQTTQNGTAKLIYNANNGTGAPAEESYALTGTTTSYTFTISSTIPTREGYTFKGWSTINSATTASYVAGNAISVGNEAKTLYAVWELKQNGTAKLVYNTNNGSGAPSEATYALTGTTTSYSFTISSTVPTRAGYNFKGWSENSGATTASYSAGGTISVGNETKTLYAVWELKQNGTAKLVYNANNGTGAPAEESYELTGTTTSYTFTISNMIPTREGYTFKGWATSNTATTASYTAGGTISVENETKTLYAVWEEETIADIVKIGDYVTYVPSSISYTVSTTSSGYTDEQTYNPSSTTSWRVFSNDGTNVEIISVGGIGGYLTLGGSTGYINAVQTLNDLANAYVNPNYALGGRSLGYSDEGLTSSQITNYQTINTSSYPLIDNVSGFPYTDNQYISDITVINNNSWSYFGVWLASRYVESSTYSSNFYVRTDRTSYELYASCVDEYFEYFAAGNVVPIITLKPTIKITGGSGTSADPYTISY